MKNLKELIVTSTKNRADYFRLKESEYRTVNGLKVLYLRYIANTKGIDFEYQMYAYLANGGYCSVSGYAYAKYFDQNNWLFFTKERFDLLYPSYGDTYPMYNGAIGMTYEQGGISAGLGVQDKNNDTVTLVGRALHHFTTGMSTVEISAMNHQKLITEFKKYYQNSRAGNHGMYQTYLMTSSSAHKIKAIADVLKKNNIQFGTYTGGNGLKAFDYHTKSEGNYTNEGYTIAVAAAQVHGVLASVL